MEEKRISDVTAENVVSGNAKEDFELAIEKESAAKSDAMSEREHIRAERYKARAAALRDKNRRRAEKRAMRESIRQERAKLREERKNSGENNGRPSGGWIAAVVTLGLSTLVLATLLTYTAFMPAESDGRLNSAYAKSFYDTVVQVDNMDLNLSKVLATRDSGAVQMYLTDLAVNSELAENDLQQLPIEDENKFYTTKIVNQVGDYAKYLNKKIIKGGKISAEDYENLRNLYNANASLKNALSAAMKDMDGDFNFADMGKSLESNSLLKNFDELQELSVEFPELIYDGPFSDGRDNMEIKGLSGSVITEAEAREIFVNTFDGYGLENVTSSGKSTGNIPAFGVQAEVKGDLIYAQITETGGKLIMFSYAGSCGAVNYEEDFVVEKALGFIEGQGLENMKPVWVNLSNNVYTINFAPETNGVIVYPDLVKVRVCAETGMIIGLEAAGYYSNHTEREIGAPALSRAEARSKVSDEISVETARLAIVPIGEKTETLCYEFSGTMDGETYYVYIDANSGRQVEMFKVINSEEGKLLM